jgi:hypothetical protein
MGRVCGEPGMRRHREGWKLAESATHGSAGTRRVLSARGYGRPYGLTLYETAQLAASVQAWYEQSLRASRWVIEGGW